MSESLVNGFLIFIVLALIIVAIVFIVIDSNHSYKPPKPGPHPNPPHPGPHPHPPHPGPHN